MSRRCYEKFISCVFCTIYFVIFLRSSFFLNKNPIAKRKSRCYNVFNKRNLQSPFHFLISLFSWTPRDCLVNNPGALHVRRPDSQFVRKTSTDRYFPAPLGIVPLCDPRLSICGESPLTMRAQLVCSRKAIGWSARYRSCVRI